MILSSALVTSTVQAACKYSRSAFIPSFTYQSGRLAFPTFSNTSDFPVELTLELYDHDGSDVPLEEYNTGNIRSLPAKGVARFSMIGSGTVSGKVTWTSQDCLKKPVIGYVEIRDNNYGFQTIPIQNMKRF